MGQWTPPWVFRSQSPGSATFRKIPASVPSKHSNVKSWVRLWTEHPQWSIPKRSTDRTRIPQRFRRPLAIYLTPALWSQQAVCLNSRSCSFLVAAPVPAHPLAICPGVFGLLLWGQSIPFFDGCGASPLKRRSHWGHLECTVRPRRFSIIRRLVSTSPENFSVPVYQARVYPRPDNTPGIVFPRP